MTREEQIACLTDRPCDVCKFHSETGCSRWKCVFEETHECDCISREAVSRIKTRLEYDFENAIGIPKSYKVFAKRVVSNAFADLPSVEPTKPHGEWILIDSEQDIYRCTNCKRLTHHKGDFCINCGADMRGKADEDNLQDTNETTEP